MTPKDLKEAIDRKRRGFMATPAEQAEVMDAALELGEQILKNESMIRTLTQMNLENRNIISDIKMYFPALYREIRREFLKPKDTQTTKTEEDDKQA